MASIGVHAPGDGHYKDVILANLAQHQNVAQFVSFAPGTCEVRAMCISGGPRNPPASVEDAIDLLLSQSAERSVNVRAFDPHQPKSHEFLYGLTTVSDAAAHVRRLAATGLFTIANETVDVTDGGVSGVMYGGVIEFSPDDTPRCVEKPGTMSLPRELGLALLQTVFGFAPDLTQPDHVRVEFSIHPVRRGVRHGHTLVWEEEEMEPVGLQSTLVWPNRFSRLLGDKAFGLLLADAIGLHVPRTTVIGRRLAPFAFGRPTGTAETWIRTAPTEPVPGRFTTSHGWTDPYRLMAEEDPTGDSIASVIAQEAVEPAFSGAAASRSQSMNATVEGVRGEGDRFMLGEARPEPLPAKVTADVREALRSASTVLGHVHIEWVHDGESLWAVQIHRGEFVSVGNIVYPGTPTAEHEFDVNRGLEELRVIADQLSGTGEGVVLIGQVGVTSHFGDVLRRARVPSRIEPRGTILSSEQLQLRR